MSHVASASRPKSEADICALFASCPMTTDPIEALAKSIYMIFSILIEIGSFNYWPNSGGICYSKLHMTGQDVTHLSKATRRLFGKAMLYKGLMDISVSIRKRSSESLSGENLLDFQLDSTCLEHNHPQW
jgi:hypothetical protein